MWPYGRETREMESTSPEGGWQTVEESRQGATRGICHSMQGAAPRSTRPTDITAHTPSKPTSTG